MRSVSASRQCSERGATLLTVLFIVFLMSTAALASIQAVTGMLVSVRAVQSSQARGWLAAAAVEAAAAVLETNRAMDPDRMPANSEVAVPGGRATIHFDDATNCFNLNALVPTAPDRAGNDSVSAGRAAFIRLLVAAGQNASQGESIERRVSAWIAEQQAQTSARFVASDPLVRGASWAAFRTSGEISAVRDLGRDVRVRLKPLLCAGKPGEMGALNINTLTTEQVPVLAALLGEDVEAGRLVSVIERRPAGGWLTADEFVIALTERGIGIPEAALALLMTAPQTIAASVLVEDASGRMVVEADLQPRTDGRVEILRSRWEMLE